MSGYVLYGSQQSLFTRKLQAALDCYGVDYRFRAKRGSGHESMLERRAGTHQIPVLHTPEDWVVADTTPIIAMLDGRYPRRRLFPPGVAGLIAHLVEEIFDEWIARTMVHYRWHYPESTRVAAEQLANGDPVAAEFLRNWGPRACRATGTEHPELQAAAEQEYRLILDAMEKQLTTSDWLLGSGPTAADCAVLGGLLAHTLNDPDPAKILHGYPRVVRWAGVYGRPGPDEELTETPFAEPNGFARHILQGPAAAYRSFLLGNRKALAAGDRSFTVTSFGHVTSYLARPYPEHSSRMLAQRVRNLLDDAEREQAIALLEAWDLDECFL